MSAISESSASSTRHFTLRRIHSLVGVLPLGTFLVYHFWFHAQSHLGPAVYDGKLAELYASPFKHVFAWLTVYLPLAYHSIYGIFITREAAPNFLAYGRFRNWMYVLQRASGIGLLLFIPAHLVKARFPHVFFAGERMSFAHEAEGLRHLLTILVYVAGILGACFHLANGLFTFGITWGLWIGPNAQARAARVSIALFVLFSAMGFYALAGFR
ncbi:MAG: succinate dehydrogenase [Candidatus Eiseniibacteriota bacterium]